ncbi:unnamed protein product [Linum trigynum]|uniref:Uncharacterized protein n=1 Tax=Linum trigynum TaxID=586398 RepID=A0AAV2CAZ7_9ROSI
MLSNALSEVPPATLSLTPSGRPPDFPMAETTQKPATVGVAGDSMAVDPSAGNSPVTAGSPAVGSVASAESNPAQDNQPNQAMGGGPSAGTQSAPTQLPLSYAKAVAGIGQQSLTKPPEWTPVGEHDLVTGNFNGEPSLTLSDTFKGRLCAPWQKTLVVRLLGLHIGTTSKPSPMVLGSYSIII